MTVSDQIAATGRYAQQLLDNKDVRATARQAADATRGAYQRARGQDARKAVQDRKLRRRVTAAVAAVGEFFGAVSKTPPKQKSPWPRRIAVLTVTGAAAGLTSNTAVRTRIQRLFGQDNPDDAADPSTFDQPSPS